MIEGGARTAGMALALAVAYFATGHLGLQLPSVHPNVTLVWPPIGIALWALIRGGPGLWPGVTIGALLVNLGTGAPVAACVAIAMGNTLGVALPAAGVQRIPGFDASLSRVRDVVGLILLGAGAGPVLTASTGAASLWLSGSLPPEQMLSLWTSWFVGDAISVLLLTPALLALRPLPREWRTPLRLAEGAGTLGLVALVAYFAFGGVGQLALPGGLGFACVPPVILAALRFGPAGAALAALASSVFAISSTLSGSEALVDPELLRRQAFIGVVALSGLFFGSAIEERRAAEKQLRASEERYRLLVHTVPHGISEVDPGGTITFSNRRPGGDKEGAWGRVGARVWDLGESEAERERARQTIEQVARTQPSPFPFVLRERLPGGRLAVSQIDWDYKRDVAGRLAGFVAVVTDITERERAAQAQRHLEQELRERADELARAARAKDEFLALLGHELRSPMAAIRAGLDGLAATDWGAAGSSELRGRLGSALQHQTRLLSRLVDDLLDVSRVERGAVELRLERVDLASAVQHALEAVSPLLEHSGHQLRVSLPPEPVLLQADPARLEQIISNLLANAAKYTPHRGNVGVRAERQGDDAVIRVRDDGIGIRSESLPHVFEGLWREARPGDRRPEGFGLGLALVRSLVELHGGRVTAQSDGPGKGSEFCVRLPLGKLAAEPATAAAAEAAPAVEVPRRVLLVEDDPDVAETLATLLAGWGHAVEVAHDGKSALESARRLLPEVVLLDLGLPDLDGFEVARRLRADAQLAGLTIVALTGFGQPEDRMRSAAAGFDAHLVKPGALGELRYLLGELPQRAAGRARTRGDSA